MAPSTPRRAPDIHPENLVARIDITADRDRVLEAAIVAEPDARELLLVYADWLQSRQQPLGEVIALAIAAEREPKRQRKLKVNATRALVEYVEQHLARKYPDLVARMLAFQLGPKDRGADGIGGSDSASIVWRRGLVDSIETWQWKPSMREQMFELLNAREAMLLRRITIRDHAIGELGFLAHLRALERIELTWADAKQLRDLAPLAQLPRLAWLDVRHSQVDDLSPLRALPLRKLVVGGCPVADLSPLARHPTLECIDVAGTQVADVTPLLECPRLCNVSLWDARVSTRDAERLVAAMKKTKATPSPGADYQRHLSHNDANWY